MSGAQGPDVIRVGVLGCARIARKLVRAMLRADGVVPYAVGSRSLSKAEAFRDEMKALDATCSLIVYGSYDRVLQDADVDMVYIPLPTGLHVEWVVKAAQHGKHILLEKPVSLSMQDLVTMLEACDKAGVQIMDGTMWVHGPRAAAMKEILSDPTRFGSLSRVYSNFFFKAGEDFLTSNIRVQKGLDELGALGDIGWYCVRAALWASNYELPSEVRAIPGTLRNEQGVIMSCGATLVWGASGRVAVFECGFDGPLRQLVQFAGTRGTVTLDDFTIPHREDEMSFSVEEEGAIVDGGTRTSSTREMVTVRLAQPQEVLMVEELAGIVRRVKQQGRAGLVKFWADTMWKTMRVVLAVEESASLDCQPVLLATEQA